MGLGTGVAVLNSQAVPISQVVTKTDFTVFHRGPLPILPLIWSLSMNCDLSTTRRTKLECAILMKGVNANSTVAYWYQIPQACTNLVYIYMFTQILIIGGKWVVFICLSAPAPKLLNHWMCTCRVDCWGVKEIIRASANKRQENRSLWTDKPVHGIIFSCRLLLQMKLHALLGILMGQMNKLMMLNSTLHPFNMFKEELKPKLHVLKQNYSWPAFFWAKHSWVPLAGRPVSCKPLDSFFTPSDWTRYDCTACRVHQKMVNSCRRARYSG